MGKFLKIILVVGLFGAIALMAQADVTTVSAYPQYDAKTDKISVAPADLGSAGFTGISKLSPVNGRYVSASSYFPVSYFKVKQTLSADQAASWGDAANLVSVFIRPIVSGWVFNNGLIKENNLNGKTQIEFSTAGNYISIIGPDHDKVVALGNILKAKY